VRSLPTAWTNLAAHDSYVQIAAGRALLRMVDLQLLSSRLHELATDPDDGILDNDSL